MNNKDTDATVPLSAVPKAGAKLALGEQAGTDHKTQALAALAPPPPGPPPGAPTNAPTSAPPLHSTEAATVIGPITLPPQAAVTSAAVAPATVALSAVEVGVKPLGQRSAFDGPRIVVPDGRATGVRNKRRVKFIFAGLILLGVGAGSAIDAIPRVWTGIAIMAGVVTLAMFIFGERDAAR